MVFVVVNADLRKEAERAIEHYANLIAVAVNCGRSISSPFNCVAFNPENAEEREWLADKVALLRPELTGQMRGRPELDLEQARQLADRLDGVALMAEALSISHATGRFHEFYRLFERAFRLTSHKLARQLNTFLSVNGQGFTLPVITSLVKDKRDRASHADRSAPLLLESDVRPVIWRVEQAAYDVLLNKATWADNSVNRRHVWTQALASGSPNPQAPLVVDPGRPIQMQLALLDEFGVYVQDQQVLNLPPTLWAKQLLGSVGQE